MISDHQTNRFHEGFDRQIVHSKEEIRHAQIMAAVIIVCIQAHNRAEIGERIRKAIGGKILPAVIVIVLRFKGLLGNCKGEKLLRFFKIAVKMRHSLLIQRFGKLVHADPPSVRSNNLV